MKKVLFPGSFDPITYGHMNVIEQALNIYDKVIVAVMVNSRKNSGWFSLEERKNLISEIYKDNPKVEVIAIEGKIAAVDVALENGCTTMVRGLRHLTDFDEELQNNELNLILGEGKVTTIALFANPKTIAISSSKVKEVFSLGKSIDPFVHPCVKDAIIRKFTKEEFK